MDISKWRLLVTVPPANITKPLKDPGREIPNQMLAKEPQFSTTGRTTQKQTKPLLNFMPLESEGSIHQNLPKTTHSLVLGLSYYFSHFPMLGPLYQPIRLIAKRLQKGTQFVHSCIEVYVLVEESRELRTGIRRRAEAMKHLLKISAIALLALVTFVPAASARGFYGGGGGGFVGGGYGMGFYPGYYGGYGPWYGSSYYNPNAGEVEIQTKHKGDQIIVDGGYAGLTGNLKKFPLRAGTHTIELRNAKGQTFYQEKITVIAGKKLKIQSDSIG
jgi:hypothetical protein